MSIDVLKDLSFLVSERYPWYVGHKNIRDQKTKKKYLLMIKILKFNYLIQGNIFLLSYDKKKKQFTISTKKGFNLINPIEHFFLIPSDIVLFGTNVIRIL